MANWKGLTLTGCNTIRLRDVYGNISDRYEISFNDGASWSTFTFNVDFTVPAGASACVRIANSQYARASNKILCFVFTGSVSASGNINSMIEPNFESVTNISSHPYALVALFQGCTNLVDVSKLELPATTLSNFCYWRMFQGCESLLVAPKLPATTLTESCYQTMFKSCYLLAEAPELPAMVATKQCYAEMFDSCLALAKPPKLPATTVGENSYTSMFSNCRSLTDLPNLPATTISSQAYNGMFRTCTGIELSKSQTDYYTKPWRFPTSGTTTASDMTGMFSETGGTYKGSGSPNTTYYLHKELPEPLKFEMTEGSSTVVFSSTNLEWSTNKVSWTVYNAADLQVGTPLYCRACSTTGTNPQFMIRDDCKVNISGDIASLIKSDSELQDRQFMGTFQNCYQIVDASGLILSPEKLTRECYCEMFEQCTGLVHPPKIMAKEMGINCCANMFNYCSKLAEVPEFSPTVLNDYCFQYMFVGCESLTEAMELPLTDLVLGCYKGMFHSCPGLTEIPDLPATIMAPECYEEMFQYCTGLTEVPTLPTTTLARECYAFMFAGCENLTVLPELPLTTLAEGCYEGMFADCSALTDTPVLPATTLAPFCYQGMFNDCTSLEEPPVLPATTLAGHCYAYMLEGCTKLKNAPELPVMTIPESAYAEMLKNCTSLTEAPVLPATVLEQYCYDRMFEGCTGLTVAPELPATTLSSCCYYSMFKDCTGLTLPVELPALTLDYSCYQNMFQGCTGIKISDVPTSEYAKPYRVPTVGEGTTAYDNSLTDMFSGTSGPWSGTPEINRTYYLYYVIPEGIYHWDGIKWVLDANALL